MKKILTFCFLLFAFNVNAMEKETTFKKELFDKAQSEGKVVVVSSWIKYCMSCASQMKVLEKAEKIDYLIVETTGLADPLPVAMTFAAGDLREKVRLDSIITVIDGENFDFEISNLENLKFN